MIDPLSIGITLFYTYLVITVVFLLLDNREPASTLAWILIFVLVPVFGFFLYLLVGRNKRNLSKREKDVSQFLERHVRTILAPLKQAQQREIKKLTKKGLRPKTRELMELLARNSDSIVLTNNKVKIFHKGIDNFSSLLRDLAKAKKSIHMEHYILKSDKLGQQIKEILVQKAKQGVEIRIIYSLTGNIFLKRKYVRELYKAGVQIRAFYNIPSLIVKYNINYQNHRKIVVIDGKIGYTGGMNIGQEYIDGGKRFESWRDTHMRITGQATTVLQTVFAIDWYNTTKEELFAKKYFPPTKTQTKTTLPIQITTSGPDSTWPSIEQLIFSLITTATKNVYIQSPYFIPSTGILIALKTASLKGVNVHIILTGKPDKKIPYWSAFTFFEELLQAGAHIHHYQAGFMHAKVISIDSKMCSVGTANLDIRSFQLNYELNTLMYDKKIAQEIETQFIQDKKKSNEFTLKDYYKLHPAIKMRNSIARLFTPLL